MTVGSDNNKFIIITSPKNMKYDELVLKFARKPLDLVMAALLGLIMQVLMVQTNNEYYKMWAVL